MLPLRPARRLVLPDAPELPRQPRGDLVARLRNTNPDALALPHFRHLRELLECAAWPQDAQACAGVLQILVRQAEIDLLEQLLPSCPVALPRLQLAFSTEHASHAPLIRLLLEWLSSARQNGLQELVIAGQSLEGDTVSLLARVLRQHPLLTCLVLDDCDLDNQSVDELCSALPQGVPLAQLSLAGNAMHGTVPEALLQWLGRSAGLEALALNNNERLAAGNLGALSQALRSHSGLRQLELVSCGLGDADVAALTALLRHHPRLEGLHVGHNAFDPRSWCGILRALREHPSLQVFNAECTGWPAGAAQSLEALLRENQVLRSLSLEEEDLPSEIGRTLFAALAHNRGLEHLKVSGFNAHDLAQLRRAEGLRRLDLSNNAFGTADAALVARAIRACPHLEVLDLSNCALGNIGVRAFVRQLDPHGSLTRLDLRWNDLGEFGFGACHELLPKLPELMSLRINGLLPRLPAQWAPLLRDALQRHYGLVDFDMGTLEHSLPSGEAARSSIELLRRNRHLRTEAPWMLGQSIVMRFTSRLLHVPDAGIFIWRALVEGTRADAALGLQAALRLGQAASWLRHDPVPPPLPDPSTVRTGHR